MQRNSRSLAERGLPAFFQNSYQIGTHGRADVAVDAAHAGYLVPIRSD
jgi:hypothetical protein